MGSVNGLFSKGREERDISGTCVGCFGEILQDRSKTLPLAIRYRLWKGKIRRWWLLHFRKKYVQGSLERRRGECSRKGACCHLAYRCPFLRYDESGCAFCKIYSYRPLNCRVFPIDERDLADRNLLFPESPCGYYFAGPGEKDSIHQD